MKKYILFAVSITICMLAYPDYSIRLLTSNELKEIIPFMVDQRISAFRDYPYLYEGNTKEESEYCQWFAGLPHSAVVVAYADGSPVGFVSGTGFADFDIHFRGSIDLFENNGFDPKKFYYIPEVIIMPQHRKKGLLEKLHNFIEQHAKSIGYQATCLVQESHDNHPLKPVAYQSHDGLWLKLGYRQTHIIITFPWLTIQPDGSLKNEEHKLQYWINNLN